MSCASQPRQRFEGTGLMSNVDAPAPAGVGPAEVRDHCQVDDDCAWTGTGEQEPAAGGDATAPRWQS